MATDPVSETLFSLVFRIPGNEQSQKTQYFFNCRPEKKTIKVFM
jgi:hypothetical protein